MASLTQWTWVWVNSGSWWWTGRPGVLWFMGRRVGYDWATELNWIISNSGHLISSLEKCLFRSFAPFWFLQEFWVNKKSISNENSENTISFFFFILSSPFKVIFSYSLMEHEFQQVVPVLLPCNFPCPNSLFNFVFLMPAETLILWAFSGSPDSLAHQVCQYSLPCFLNLKNKHLTPKGYFPSPLEVTNVKYPFDSPRGIIGSKPPVPIWPHASTWPDVVALT